MQEGETESKEEEERDKGGMEKVNREWGQTKENINKEQKLEEESPI